MTKDERSHLGEQLLANPLFATLIAEMDARAVRECINTDNAEVRAKAAMEARVIREFRKKCEAAIKQPASAKVGIA